MSQPRRNIEPLSLLASTPSGNRSAEVRPISPDPGAHAEILVVTYGLQTAAWIAETNLGTARKSDTPYWSRVLDAVERQRAAQAHA